MHELSIVMNIIDIAEKEANKANASKIETIELDIGMLSTVELYAFDFAWEQAVKGTRLEQAEKKINHLVGKARCRLCESEFVIQELYDGCPYCEQYSIDVLQGKELRIRQMVVS